MRDRHDSVVELFDRIAPVYDRLNRIISWGRDQRWRRELVEKIAPGMNEIVLDVSVGTGDLARAVEKICPGVCVVGTDPSEKMVSIYRRKSPKAQVSLSVVEFLPFKNEAISTVVCAFGIRNFVDRAAAFAEIHRVLKPGGLWGFLEMSAPRGRFFSALYGFYFKRLVPLIGAAFSFHPYAYKYLRDSVYVFPGLDGMKAEHERAGFSFQHYRPILRGAVGHYLFRKNG